MDAPGRRGAGGLAVCPDGPEGGMSETAMTDERGQPIDRVCTTCVFCLRADHGYSNWTTEGTTLHCLARLNPALDDKEVPWSEPTPELAAALDVAKRCPKYRAGAPVWTDVEHEGFPWPGTPTPEMAKKYGYTDDDEAATLLVDWISRP